MNFEPSFFELFQTNIFYVNTDLLSQDVTLQIKLRETPPEIAGSSSDFAVWEQSKCATEQQRDNRASAPPGLRPQAAIANTTW